MHQKNGDSTWPIIQTVVSVQIENIAVTYFKIEALLNERPVLERKSDILPNINVVQKDRQAVQNVTKLTSVAGRMWPH